MSVPDSPWRDGPDADPRELDMIERATFGDRREPPPEPNFWADYWTAEARRPAPGPLITRIRRAP